MGRPTARLKQVELNRLSKQAGMHCDGGGLYLRVVPPNECSWVFRYQIAERPRTMGLGPFPEISLADARAKALAARRLKSEGNDPIEEKRRKRAAKALEDAKKVTFRQVADSFIKAHSSGWKNEKHAAQWPSTLQTYAHPLIGDLPVGAIDRSLVIRVLEPIWIEKPETARRLRGRKTSFDHETIEFSLAHGISDKTEAAYRRATAVEKRRKLMAAWADYCTTPLWKEDENSTGSGRVGVHKVSAE